MSLSKYERGYLFINGALQGECDSVSIEWQGDPVAVSTITDDFKGTFSVPKQCMITFESFVPASGMEFDPVQAWINNTVVSVKVQLGGSGISMEPDGVVMAPSLVSNPTQPTKLTIKIMCQVSKFEGGVLS